jgi:hypothetical protein
MLLLVISSCKWKDEYLDVDNDLLDSLTFPKQSYWIYKDSVTGALESVVMDTFASRMELINNAHHTYTHSNYHTTNLREYIDGIDSALWQIQMLNDGEHNSVSMIVKYDPYRASILLAAYAPVLTRPLQGLNYNVLADDSTEMTFIPSLTINGRTFENVVHVHYFKGVNRAENIYMNLNVGIIKLDQHSMGFHRTLELERWHIPR